MSSLFKHNKKRNSGLVFEFLVRQMSSDMLDGNAARYAKAVDITRRYFSEGMILSKEKQLHDVLRNTRGVTESRARRVLAEVMRHSRALDSKTLEIKKNNLIKECNYAFGQDFFVRHRVPEYRLLGSVQIILDACRSKHTLTENVANLELEEAVVRYMTTSAPAPITESKKEEIDSFVCALASKRFREKYGNSLSKRQNSLLEAFVYSSMNGDESSLFEYMNNEKASILKTIRESKVIKEIVEDDVMRSKLDEAEKRLVGMGTGNVEEAVKEIMLYQKLAEELTSNG